MQFQEAFHLFAAMAVLLGSTVAQYPVQILAASPKQLIDGFGCSLAFMGQALQSLPSSPRAAIFNLLFSRSTGAGFSILRTRISPYLSSAPGQFDYENDAEEVGTRYAISQAKALGVTSFFANAWTPVKYSKTNHDAVAGSIDTSSTSLSNYAKYLSNYAKTYSQTYGINWSAISPQNEPEITTDYESCIWQPADFIKFLGSYLKPRFSMDSVFTPVLAPESFEWFESSVAPSLSDTPARSAISIVSAHAYRAGDYVNGSIRTSGYDYFPLTKKYSKKLWISEFSNKTADVNTIKDCLRIATLVHKHLTVPEVNAWLWWWGATNQNRTEEGLYEGLIYFDESGFYEVHKRIWVLAQFARFVRPGWTRIDATAEPVKGVHITAFKSSTTSIAVVAINEGSASASIKLNFFDMKLSTLAGYRTSSSESLISIGNFAVTSGSLTINLAAQSVTTFVGSANSSASAYVGAKAFITEFNSLAGSSGASGDLITRFQTGTIDPSNSGWDETALYRQTNTNEYIQYPITLSTFTAFVLYVQRNAYADGLSFAAVSGSGALTTLVANRSTTETTQPGDWHAYTLTINSGIVPAGTQHIRILFSPTNAEWNPRLTKLVIK